MTISKKTPIGSERFALAMISAFGLSATAGEAVMMKAELRAKSGASSSLTKAYTQDYKLYAKHVTIKLADDVASLGAASSLCIENFELNLTQELEDGFCFESGVDLGDIFNKGFSIDGTLGKIKKDTTFKDYVKNGTSKAMRIEIEDTSKTIGSSDNPKITIDISKVTFEDYESDGGLNDIMRESMTIKGHYDLANDSDIAVSVVNTTSSY